MALQRKKNEAYFFTLFSGKAKYFYVMRPPLRTARLIPRASDFGTIFSPSCREKVAAPSQKSPRSRYYEII